MGALNYLSTLEAFDDEVLDRFLDQAEHALLMVDSRPDEPHDRRRCQDFDARRTQDLELAMAELVDCYPSLSADIDNVSERARCSGVRSATLDIEARPQLLHLVRLSLEVFFRDFPSAEAYEMHLREEEAEGCEEDEDCRCAYEIFDLHTRLLHCLRVWTS
jgi:hypothetical protein